MKTQLWSKHVRMEKFFARNSGISIPGRQHQPGELNMDTETNRDEKHFA